MTTIRDLEMAVFDQRTARNCHLNSTNPTGRDNKNEMIFWQRMAAASYRSVEYWMGWTDDQVIL